MMPSCSFVHMVHKCENVLSHIECAVILQGFAQFASFTNQIIKYHISNFLLLYSKSLKSTPQMCQSTGTGTVCIGPVAVAPFHNQLHFAVHMRPCDLFKSGQIGGISRTSNMGKMAVHSVDLVSRKPAS